MTKITETETFTENADGSLNVTRQIDFSEGEAPFYFITETQTITRNFVNKEDYRAQKQNLVNEGGMEMERAADKIAEAEKILHELGELAKRDELIARKALDEQP